MNKVRAALGIIFILMGVAFCYFFVGSAQPAQTIAWGVDFSQRQAESLQLDWKEAYIAILEDLQTKHIKLHPQWNMIETRKGEYDFSDTDWQVTQSQNRGADIIYVLGMKSGRWPECHIPEWAAGMPKEDVQSAVLAYVTETVVRYRDNPTITYWQVENEPFFIFGQCPDWYYKDADFIAKEVALVKSLDPLRDVIISDSGEGSLWWKAAKTGDMVGTTMYRESWVHISDNIGFSLRYLLPPIFYERKALLIDRVFGKKVICIELQAEPWAPVPFHTISLEEQAKTMNIGKFRSNVEFAKKTGLDTFYFWGAEWWYWLKEIQNKPDIWNEAKTLF